MWSEYPENFRNSHSIKWTLRLKHPPNPRWLRRLLRNSKGDFVPIAIGIQLQSPYEHSRINSFTHPLLTHPSFTLLKIYYQLFNLRFDKWSNLLLYLWSRMESIIIQSRPANNLKGSNRLYFFSHIFHYLFRCKDNLRTKFRFCYLDNPLSEYFFKKPTLPSISVIVGFFLLIMNKHFIYTFKF